MSDGASAGRIPWTLDRGRRAGELGYQPGLDGVRALAIIGVLLYHGGVDIFPGGFLGVDVFFVLSGFLITTLLLEQFRARGTIDFGRFYLGRARRLLPALLFMLVVVGIAVALIYQDAAPRFRADALASLFYVSNWWYIVADLSYFEFTGRPPLLAHLWSLAIEEQFYLLWPLLLFLLMRSLGVRGVRWVALGIAVASSLWMAYLAVRSGMPVPADPSRVYFGTDAHISGLLLGAAVATVWRPGRLPEHVSTGARTALWGTGALALACVVGAYILVTEFTPLLYRGGFLVFSAVVAVLIMMATHPAIGLGALLGSQPWRFIGQRSYGLYLWHWPVFLVTRPGLDTAWDGSEPWHAVATGAVRLAVTFGIAEVSYRFIEMPIRHGILGRTWSRLRTHTMSPARAVASGAVVLGAVSLCTLAIVGLWRVGDTASPSEVIAAIGIEDGAPTEITLPTPSATTSPQATPLSIEDVRAANGPISAIGDSVMLGAADILAEEIPGIGVDASVARMPGAFTGRVKKLSRAEQLANVVVLHPGTNGVLNEEILRSLLDPLADYDRVVVVNASVPRSWEKPNNSLVDAVIEDYPNVVLADWHAAAQGNRDYFVSDGIHLTAKGARAYADVIRRAAGLITDPTSAPSAPPTPAATATPAD